MTNEKQFEKSCCKCRFFMQGEGCCYCANPSQTNADLKRYVYWTTSCDLLVETKPEETMESVALELGLDMKTKKYRLAGGEAGSLTYYEK